MMGIRYTTLKKRLYPKIRDPRFKKMSKEAVKKFENLRSDEAIFESFSDHGIDKRYHLLMMTRTQTIAPSLYHKLSKYCANYKPNYSYNEPRLQALGEEWLELSHRERDIVYGYMPLLAMSLDNLSSDILNSYMRKKEDNV